MIRSFFIFLVFVASLYPQTDYLTVRHRINELLKDEYFTSTSISISAYDLTEGHIILDLDSKKLLRPASNMKILTSAAGLLFLGDDYTFRTSLAYTGSIINKTLYGDLYIQGGCDPDFTSDDLDTLINQLYLNNITEISGSIFLDVSFKDTLFWGKGWMWDDDPSTDAPYLSAVNINDNAVKVFLSPGNYSGQAVLRTEPETRYFNIINQTITTDANIPLAFVTRDWVNRTNNIIAHGRVAPADSEFAVVLNVFAPEDYFMHLFFERADIRGIKTGGIFSRAVVPEMAYNLYTFERPLDTVIVNLNKISDNLSAEMVLYALAEKYYGRPATINNGIRLIDSLIVLSGNDPLAYVLADGSGVSHYNLISTKLINDILRYIFLEQGELYPKLYNSFPVGGVDGTLRNRMKRSQSENNVHAKTGTLSGVSSLSGYLTNTKGNLISFSIMLQNYRGSAGYARYIQDTICSILASF
jgi:serine-type D-Ala-D-Ala carboxypeptidase/endopeptidase (penicillin-binding protein 4)